jgi:nucleoside-triphosphatase
MAIEPVTGEGRSEFVARRATTLLLTGRPGVGKTTIARKVAEKLLQKPDGFYTEEIREGRERRGFRAVTFAGDTRVIADVDFGPPRVGRYGVDVEAIDLLADATLRRPAGMLFVVDEIGKMECMSRRFVEAMHELLDSGRSVIATVGERGTGFIAAVKRRPDAELWEVTLATRDAMPSRVLAWLAERL